MRVAALAIIVIIFGVPQGAASDPLYDPTCPDVNTCVGPGTCTPAACIPRACQPLIHCESDVASPEECAQNLTIEGETCQGVLSVGVRTNERTDAVGVHVALTDGHVDAFNLPNTWIAPSVQASLVGNGVDFGTVTIGAYRSVITSDHEWTNVAVVVAAGEGLTGAEHVVVGVRFLDGAPDGCYLATSRETLAECPSRTDVEQTLP